MNRFGHIPIAALTIATIEEYRQAELARGLSNDTINRNLRDVKAICNFAVEFGILKENPIERLKCSRVRTPQEGSTDQDLIRFSTCNLFSNSLQFPLSLLFDDR